MSTYATGSAHIAWSAVCALFVAACSGTSGSDARPVIIAFDDAASADFGAIEVRGVETALVRQFAKTNPGPEQWESVLAVHTGAGAQTDGSPAVLGTYRTTSDGIRFTPRFAPVPGQAYTVRFDPGGLSGEAGTAMQAADTVVSFGVPPGGVLTRVASIHPTTDVVPVNLLRLYVTFTAPMSSGEAWSRIHLVDSAGTEVEDAFLVVPQELWDPSRRRLTVLFDPGRIKRGLRPHEEAGLPLRVGHAYTIVIDSAWRDAAGRPLASSFRRTFTVTDADRSMPRTAEWRVTAPRPSTEEPLHLHFPEPLDAALLDRVIEVRRDDGTVLEGRVEIGDNETRWSFSPVEPWVAGRYVVAIGTELEDLAGNSLRRVFDTDAEAGESTPAVPAIIELPFVVTRR